MASTYKISYTPEAQEDLRQITESILQVAWPRSAEKWLNKIIDKISALTIFPNGHPYYRYDNHYRSIKIGKYLAVYEVHTNEKVVSVLRIIYARRNLKKIIQTKHKKPE